MAIHQFRTAPNYEQPLIRVDREAGIIRDVTVVSQGAAKGHGVDVSGEFVGDVVALGAAREPGIKSRFNHPNICSGSFGTMAGVLKNFRATGENQSAIADFHVSPAAEVSEKGDMKEYLFRMAENHPEQFGLSIEFSSDGKTYVRDDAGKLVEYQAGGEDEDEFLKKYLRIVHLHAADVVDDPAATDGLFSSSFLYSTHLSVRITEWLDANPEVYDWAAAHPELVSKFFRTYSEYRSRKETGTKKHDSTMKKKSFLAGLLNWLKNKQFNIDLTDTGGNSLRVMTDADAPAPGDPLLVVPPDGGEPTAAPDGNYTIAGGDLDGAVIIAADGLIADFQPSEMEAPEDAPPPPADPGQMSAPVTAAQFSALQAQLQEREAKITSLQTRITELERQPAGEHTDPEADEDFTFSAGTDIMDTPWNKKGAAMAAQGEEAKRQIASRPRTT